MLKKNLGRLMLASRPYAAPRNRREFLTQEHSQHMLMNNPYRAVSQRASIPG